VTYRDGHPHRHQCRGRRQAGGHRQPAERLELHELQRAM